MVKNGLTSDALRYVSATALEFLSIAVQIIPDTGKVYVS